ncbi:hypothetical protein [Cryobacterium sp. GrIS_2_6]|uniref:hypothetical protein n=1 Tax=Cryobacterium sp. GrIS_2_6 TaxID=3162785 RepID=UPI002DFF6E0F|nr:hypothetical protein [Cryobacterium psychrotolerans]
MDSTEEVTKLTGTEGGRWRVWTQGSSHLLDLDAMTVERVPGPGRPASFNDRPRPIRTIEECNVGASGRWTMVSDDPEVEFFWHVTSTVRRIERVAEPE